MDVASQGFSSFIPSLSINRSSSPVAKTTTVEVQENNTTNSQRRSPRCSELKRGYSIGKHASYLSIACIACVCHEVPWDGVYVCAHACVSLQVTGGDASMIWNEVTNTFPLLPSSLLQCLDTQSFQHFISLLIRCKICSSRASVVNSECKLVQPFSMFLFIWC